MSGSNKILVRRMMRQDISRVMPLEKSVHKDERWSSAFLSKLHRAKFTHSWVAEIRGEVIGYCMVMVDLDIAEIARIVDREHSHDVLSCLVSQVINALGDGSIECYTGNDEPHLMSLLSKFDFRIVNQWDDLFLMRRGRRFRFAPDLKYRMQHR